MRLNFKTWPAWLKVLLYFLILTGATFLVDVIPVINNLYFYFVLSFLMSWLFLRLEGNTLATLGLTPVTKKNWISFFSGFGIGTLMLVITIMLIIYLSKTDWKLNHHIDPMYFIMGFIFVLLSAFVQEFIFRGYPFQTLLKSYKPWLAQLIIIIPFGLMHVHFGMSLSAKFLTILITGMGSVLFGVAYIKTKKLYLPVGLHLGVNYAQEIILQKTNDQRAIVLITKSNLAYNSLSYLVPYLSVFIIGIIVLYLWKPKYVSRNISN